MNKTLKIVIYGFILFIFLYRPFSAIGVDATVALLIAALLVIVYDIFKKGKYVLQFLKRKTYFLFVVGILLSSLICAFSVALNNINFTLYDLRIIQHLTMLANLVLALFIVSKLLYSNFTRTDIFNLLINVAMAQGLICLLMLLIPPLREIAINIFIANSHFEKGDFILTTRVYGLADSYTYGLPIVNGLISGLCTKTYLDGERKNLYKIPIIFSAALLNGRTGIICGISSIIIAIVFVKTKNRIRSIIAGLLILLIAIIALLVLKNIAPPVYAFMMQLTNLSQNDTFNRLIGDAIFFPSTENLLFGVGSRVYGETGIRLIGKSSDVGFVNYIFLGGISYLFTIVTTYFLFIKNTIFSKGEKSISLFAMLLIVTAVSFWKGEIFNCSNYLMCIYFICSTGVIKTIIEKGKYI